MGHSVNETNESINRLTDDDQEKDRNEKKMLWYSNICGKRNILICTIY